MTPVAENVPSPRALRAARWAAGRNRGGHPPISGVRLWESCWMPACGAPIPQECQSHSDVPSSQHPLEGVSDHFVTLPAGGPLTPDSV